MHPVPKALGGLLVSDAPRPVPARMKDEREDVTLDAHLYGDPETVLMNKQEAAIRRAEAQARKLAACSSCVNSVPNLFYADERLVCRRGHEFGTRCRHYKEKSI